MPTSIHTYQKYLNPSGDPAPLKRGTLVQGMDKHLSISPYKSKPLYLISDLAALSSSNLLI
jgi:hypothetical protein